MPSNFIQRALALVVLAGALQVQAAGEIQAAPYSFALIGDVPYGLTEEPQFDRVIAEINATRSVRFIVHSGDVKQGSERCDDAVLQRRFDQFQKFERAFIVTPGDNDWTDCHRANNGSYLPTERLTRFRQIYYPVPGRSTGTRPIDVVTQAATAGYATYVENVHWTFNGVTLATVHVVGSNNNLDPWSGIDAGDSYANPRPDRLAEFTARETAALAWIDTVFDEAVAQKSAGVVLAIQANPLFDTASTAQARLGFNKFIDKLRLRAVAFRKPVLLTHGDSHYFRLDKPLAAPVVPSGSAMLENFTRLENFGTPSVHWIEVFVDTRDPNVFRVVPHIVPGNLFPR
ncbi:MAG: hypothetical protein H7Z19_00840 [Chitinophagaceae bacterium]|nr:hypothetical protein [Rubrivivax sp.]